MTGHYEPAAPVFPLDVHGKAERDPLRLHPVGRPLAHDESVAHDWLLLGGLDDCVGDQVGKRDLFRTASGLEPGIETAALLLEDGDRQLAEGGGRGDGQALVHVGDELGGGALDRAGPAGPRGSGAAGQRGAGSAGMLAVPLVQPSRCLACPAVPLSRCPAAPLPRCPAAPPSRSPTTPLSNRRRHSGPTAAGSRRNSSYMACAKPALAVSNTFGSTSQSQLKWAQER